MDAFKSVGEYKYYSQRVTKSNTGLKLKYYEIRNESGGYKCSFDEKEIKTDVIFFFKQWIGWKFEDKWIPKGIRVSVNDAGIKHYYVASENEVEYDISNRH